MEYLNELNEPQRKAVEQTEGPVMIIAGAGSGKTRVLMYRTAHLINTGVDPFNILALTFTNKAAREMRHRISTIVSPSEAKNVWMGTFHSIFSKILRIESDKITYPSNFTIFDTTDSRSLIKRLVKDNGLDPKIYKASIIHNRISNAKNNLISPDEYENDEQIIIDDEASGRPKTAELYRMYNERLFKSGAMDFDDLLFNMNILLKEFGDVLYKYQQKFKYILVDEYQDTNYAQYMIIKQLAAQHENICVVGDDAQSIYSFRGANIQNILNFKSDYSDCNVFKLEQNYRSTQFLVNAANSLIEKNNDQIQKTIWTSNDKGYKIEVKKTATDNEEGKWIADKVFEQQNEHKAEPKDFAILYRTNAQSRSIEEALRKQNIPYRIYGGLSFYQRKEIKDLMGYFRLTVNHDDEEALKRIINFPKRGIGNTTIEKAIVAADKHSKSIWEILTSPDAFQLKINKGTIEKLREFITMIKSFRTLHDSYDAYQLAHHIASSSGILKTLSTDKTPEGVNRYENVQELLNGIKEFCEQKKKEDPESIVTLYDFLLEVALLTDADIEEEGDNNRVSLMTVHAAKGLEFPFVFVTGLEENLFPSQMSLHSREDLEEERRLFYVAITRAEKHAYISYALNRYKWGNLITSEPSRFIDEIDQQYLDIPSSHYENEEPESSASVQYTHPANKGSGFSKKRMKKVKNQDNGDTKTATESELQVGTEVKHQKFGKGKVLKLEGNLGNKKATVFFPNVGQKKLLLKFAKLDVLN